MPRIAWTALPKGVQEHLLDRVRIRAIDAKDLTALLAWVTTNPEVPDGPWCKDFGTFKLVGHGRTPSAFLEKNQPCFGERI